jgi:PAS domain S-box-containing protein
MSLDRIEVLVLEDNDADFRLIVENLKESAVMSYEIAHVKNLSDALKAIKEKKFDILLSDLNLPDSHGLFTVEHIVQANPELPVVVLTGFDDDKLGIDAIQKGAQDYLAKNCVQDVLLARSVRYAIERKRSEVALARERYNLQMIFDTVNVGMLLIDEHGVVVRVNNVVACWASKDPQTLCMSQPGDILKCVHSVEDHAGCGHSSYCHACPIRNTFESVLRSGKAIHGIEAEVLFLVDGNQVRRWLELSADPVMIDKKQQTILALNDITGRKQAESQREVALEALRQSQEDLKRAQAVGHIGNWRLNVQRNELIWSDENYRIFGVPKEMLLTYETFLSFIHPDDRDYVDKKWKASMAGEDYDIEHRIIADGQVKWVREKAFLEFDKKGALLAGFGIAQDITSLKNAEEVLKRDKDVLEKLVHEKAQELMVAQNEIDRAKRLSDIGTLAAAVAHELRNPLAAIGLSTYHIKKTIADPQIEVDLGAINKRISEADQIINNILSYSKIKIGRFQAVKINSILKECINEAMGRFSGQNIAVNVKIDNIEGVSIKADPLQIKEVFSNILNNAFDALNKNAGIIDIESRVNDSTVFVLIKDNGEGIEKDHLKKIFDPFFTTKAKGTGLGLAVCNMLVMLHDGSITIESEKGIGTTATIALPMRGLKDE